MAAILQKYPIRNKQDLKNTFREAYNVAEKEVNEGHDAWVFVVSKHKVKSLKQGRYLWGVVYKIIAQELGEEPKEVHRYYKELLEVPTTKHLSTLQMTDYIERLRRHALVFLGIRTPDPNEIPEEVLIEMQSKGIL